MAEYLFQKLTPISDAELGVYENALDYVFEHDDIRNVAISGSYSAGKSSILASYKQKREDRKYIHISLAHFEPTKDDAGFEEDAISETALEGKILNQLIHKIEPSKIPQTNFRIKRRISNKSIFGLTASLVASAVLSFICFGAALIESIGDNLTVQWLKDIMLFFTKGEVRLISGILVLAAFSVVLFEIVKAQKNKHILRKVGVKDVDIEIFESDTESYFDKYLNEVLYLFESSDVDVIVFEDMDRFNVNRIFERLREINILVNERRTVEEQKPLRFFYLLRDDIFITKDRTKFFDFIIPVIPVVDSSNAFDKFKEQFEQQGIFTDFEGGFLQGISLYVDDMRILKNIFNEFLVYRSRLDTTELDINKLLAMIVYKNIFPRDFSDLQLNRGFVYALFAARESYITEAIAHIDTVIDGVQKKIDDANNEHLEKSAEVDTVYNAQLSQYRNSWNYQNNANYKELVALIANRKAAVENRKSDNMAGLEQQLLISRQQKAEIKSLKLHDLFENYCDIDTIFKDNKSVNAIGTERKYTEIKESPYFDLLKYLVRNGYLEESYADYMSYFYANSLSQKDKIFMRSVTDRKAKPWTFKIDYPQLIIDGLRDVDFTHPEILNFNLLFYMLESQEERQRSLLGRVFEIITGDKKYEFVQAVYSSDENYNIPLFTIYLSSKWLSLMQEAISGVAGFTTETMRKFVVSTLSYCNEDSVSNINSDGSLAAYISENPEFLDMTNTNFIAPQLIKNIEAIEVSFVSIDYDKSDKGLFEEIYKRSLYALNANNILLMLEKQCGVAADPSVWSRQFTILSNISDEVIVGYINGCKDHHIEIVLAECNGEITDDVTVVESVLSDSEISIDNRKQYIKCLKTVLPSFENMQEVELWAEILSHCCIEYTEENILEYYTHQGLDTVLVAFIQTQKKALDFSSWHDSNRSDLFDGVVPCKELREWHYREILRALKYHYKDGFDIATLNGYKIDILIELKIVSMGAENLLFFRENYPDKVLDLILADINAYVTLINEDNYSTNEMLSLLPGEATDEQKIKLLSFENDALPVTGKGYTEIIENHILKNNLDETELQPILQDYPSKPQSTQEIIFKIAIDHVDTIISERYELPDTLFEKLLASNSIDQTDKEKLLISRLASISEEQCKYYLDLINHNELATIFDGKRPKVEKSDEMEVILSSFESKKWITSFVDDQQDSDYYRVYGKKASEQDD